MPTRFLCGDNKGERADYVTCSSSPVFFCAVFLCIHHFLARFISMSVHSPPTAGDDIASTKVFD